MIQKLVVAFIVLAGLIGMVFVYLLFQGPRMRTQVSLKSFEAAVTPLPQGAVFMNTAPPLPTEAEAGSLATPLPPTPENIARGGVYYEYYCVYCHGETGDGNGLVGESYVPTPADLRQAKFSQYSDGELLRACLLGTGHAPVLERVVAPAHRWYVVLYARHLNRANTD